MRIQSFLNVSNQDDIQSDSGFVFQKLIASELISRGHDFCFVSPVPLGVEGALHEFHEFGNNKFQVRFNFAWDRIQAIIEEYQPDVLLINQAELSANFRSILCTIGSSAQLITYVHYLPVNKDQDGRFEVDSSLNNADLGLPILLSLLGSVKVSDKVLVQSKFAKKTLKETLHLFRIPFESNKIFIVPPPFDPFLVSSLADNEIPRQCIMYNHRLYEHYGTDYFLKIIKSLKDKTEIQFLVADLLASRNGTRQKLDNHVDHYRSELKLQPNVSFARNKNRNDYKKAIEQCRAGLAAYRKMAVWSMSVVDCLGMGVPVIAPNFASYPEFIPQSLLYNSFEEFQNILDSLFNSDTFWEEVSAEGKDKIKPFSPAIIAGRLTEIMEL
ncbi:MAG: glycosyltransferase [Saprospiraceae bacterium]|nr:glycosyltransferase [Saprospiraceae bacterium]